MVQISFPCLRAAALQKDKSQLTVAEVREAKARKEAMLRSSIREFRVLDDGEDGA